MRLVSKGWWVANRTHIPVPVGCFIERRDFVLKEQVSNQDRNKFIDQAIVLKMASTSQPSMKTQNITSRWPTQSQTQSNIVHGKIVFFWHMDAV